MGKRKGKWFHDGGTIILLLGAIGAGLIAVYEFCEKVSVVRQSKRIKRRRKEVVKKK